MKLRILATAVAIVLCMPFFTKASPSKQSNHYVVAVSSRYPGYQFGFSISSSRDQVYGVSVIKGSGSSQVSFNVVSWSVTTSIIDATHQSFKGSINVMDPSTGKVINLNVSDAGGVLMW